MAEGRRRQECRAGAVALLGGFASMAAHAENYGGLSFGVARQQLVCAANAPCEREAASPRMFAGHRFNDRWGVELAWTRAVSDFTASDSIPGFTWFGAFGVEQTSLAATFDISLSTMHLQLRAGVAAVRGEFTSATVGVPDASRSEMRPMVGLGLRRQIGEHWAVRADLDVTNGIAYTRSGRFGTLNAGVEFRF